MSIERQVAELAIRLMEVESTSGHEAAVITVAEQLLADRRWNTERIPVGDGRDAILATSAPAPLVTLSTHLDTVPPYMPPHLDGDTLHGRGACDAKGIAASMILAADRLRDRDVPVALLLVVGEETTHDGAHAANARPTTSRILINGEPTESTLAVGTKGAMRAFVRTQGRAAHSAYPKLGHSATRDLVNLLATLDAVEWPSDPVLGATTVNIGMLSGGVADNVMAPSAEARLMLRLVTPVEEVWPILERWAAGRATVERGVTVPPCGSARSTASRRAWPPLPPISPPSRTGGHRTSSVRARFTWPTPRTSTSRSRNSPRPCRRTNESRSERSSARGSGASYSARARARRSRPRVRQPRSPSRRRRR
ncbi:MAG: M20/M25/M40 family metallo-hydrolase [Gemmatimonadetes bacterium]|nr:M20/M25/M40 family metallo-hydrolase [Gemmatimonadota bacterium]